MEVGKFEVMANLKLIRKDSYRDGGTIVAYTNKGSYFVDKRHPNRATTGRVFNKYPGEPDAKMVDPQTENDILGLLNLLPEK